MHLSVILVMVALMVITVAMSRKALYLKTFLVSCCISCDLRALDNSCYVTESFISNDIFVFGLVLFSGFNYFLSCVSCDCVPWFDLVWLLLHMQSTSQNQAKSHWSPSHLDCMVDYLMVDCMCRRLIGFRLDCVFQKSNYSWLNCIASFGDNMVCGITFDSGLHVWENSSGLPVLTEIMVCSELSFSNSDSHV